MHGDNLGMPAIPDRGSQYGAPHGPGLEFPPNSGSNLGVWVLAPLLLHGCIGMNAHELHPLPRLMRDYRPVNGVTDWPDVSETHVRLGATLDAAVAVRYTRDGVEPPISSNVLSVRKASPPNRNRSG